MVELAIIGGKSVELINGRRGEEILFSFSFRSRETFSNFLISEKELRNLFPLFFLSPSIIDIIYSKIKSRVSFDEETRRLILIAFDSIRVTAIVVNLWLRNTCTRNTDEKEDRINAQRFVIRPPYDLDIISNSEQFKFTHRGCSDGQLLGSNHVFQFWLERVGDTSIRRPGKR